jgi:hypothetical protein
MQVKCEILLEMETGEYELKVHNVSSPGEPVDYDKLKKVLERVFVSWTESQEPGEEQH